MVERKKAASSKKRPTRGATRAPEKSGLPGSLLFGAGFFSGIVATALVVAALEKNNSQQATASPVEKTASAPEPKATKTTTKFDFFTLLPEREVIVPDERPRVSAETDTSRNTPPPSDELPQQAGQRYMLQAGSFRSFNDADRRRAQIILLGLDAKVESVEANGDRWHRVYVGPFKSNNTLSDARSKLINEGIDTLVIRQKS